MTTTKRPAGRARHAPPSGAAGGRSVRASRRRALGLALALAAVTLLPAAAAAQAPTAQLLYEDAMAQEAAVRRALADPGATVTVRRAVRTVVGAFEEVVRRYPRSGYCDDALWHAAGLALDAFRQFGVEADRTTGVRVLRMLAREYPTSRWARQAPEALAAAGRAPARAVALAQPPPPRAPEPARLATITEIRRTVMADAVRITIELDGEVPFRDERLANPVRVFVDLPNTRAAPGLVDRTIRFDSDADVVRQVRLGRHPGNTTRVVLDAIGLASYSVYPLYEPYRLVIDCVRAAPAGPLARLLFAPPYTAALPERRPATTIPPGANQAGPPLLAATAAPPAAVTVANPPARNSAGGFSIARQLGLGVSRIVIDPGHGGEDPGALGKGLTEAALVLDVALRLEQLLAQVPGVEVILTRRSDAYVPLNERTAMANREGADLFLSIHANASNNTTAGGVETYFLNFANTLSAAAVAARENAASGQAMGALPEYVKAIALNNKLDESRDFAAMVQRAMIERLRTENKEVKDLGVKQAPFVVLIGAAMPSVLAEVSFLTNAQEARLLRGSVYRQRIAEALFSAIRKYQTSLNRVARLAQQ